MAQFLRKYSALILFCSLLSCSRPTAWLEQWRSMELPGRLRIDFPLDDSLFPPEIAPTTVRWRDAAAAQWFIVISTSKKDVIHSTLTKDRFWQPDSVLWQEMKTAGLAQPVTISVLGLDRTGIISGAECSIRTSPDSVGAAIFYRAVILPFIDAVHHFDRIRWHLGDISSPRKSPVLMEKLPLCGNCHSFSHDGETLAMDIDYANDKGSYVIKEIAPQTVLTPDDIITWSSYRPQDRQQTYGLLSQISPNGRYIASTVKDRSIFVATPGLRYSQLFFPIKGIIVIYDRETGQFFSLPGADDPRYVQSNPSWSPDGQWLYFARTTAYVPESVAQSKEVLLPTELAQEFIDGEREFKYDIYRIPFNDGRGGVAEPLRGASGNGKSNFFPRISPDGRHLVFCQADNFMLLQPDSKLYILPPEGGEPRLLDCNTDSMNSWHAWSPNSRWLVFSSKIRGAYTDLLLAHIDASGNASAPILLENLSHDNYAVNIPEFVNLRGSWTKIVDEFSQQAHYYFTVARSAAGNGKLAEAIENFDRAIALDPTYAKSYVYKGHIYFANDEFEKALAAYENAVKYINDDDKLFLNLGTTFYKLRQYEKAIAAFDRSINLDDQSADAFF
ncbi:PD40 domain-containing protein, partial [candidate division KSB1 bacterium]|nr:PD40 domain-containing protein [candidate division KSB1 bacterium]